MKKILPLLLSLLLLTACAAPDPAAPVENTPPAEAPTTQIANPWQEFETVEEMEAFVGFAFDVPEEVQNVGAITTYRAMENMAEVRYENGLTLRKSTESGDISGDFNEYPETHSAATPDEAGTVEMMGNDNHVHKAVWEMGGYAYAAASEEGMPVHEMAQLVMQVQ